MIDDIDYKYFDWLCDKVCIADDLVLGRDECYPERTYFELARTLHEMPFRVVHERDINRKNDVYGLRNEFCEELGYPSLHALDELEPTVFEVLLCLASQMEYDTCLDFESKTVNTAAFFWEMIGNLGIDMLDDETIQKSFSEVHAIEDAVNRWLDRTYEASGEGGIFPLKAPTSDQRNVELWYQMNAYLNENY